MLEILYGATTIAIMIAIIFQKKQLKIQKHKGCKWDG